MEIRPIATEYAALGGISWSERLALGLGALDGRAWMLPQAPDKSLLGYGRLTRLSDAVRALSPFDPDVRDLIGDELGEADGAEINTPPLERDEAATASGMRAELIAFPPAEFGPVLFNVGFSFLSAPAPMPVAVEAGDPGAVYDPGHATALRVVELHLRKLIEDKLFTQHGANWVKEGVNGAVLKKWQRNQDADRKAGRPVYPVLHYSNFTELSDIIRQNDHWEKSFASVFRNREDIAASLRRLAPIRNNIAHQRPIGRADALRLACEATWILGILGVSNFR